MGTFDAASSARGVEGNERADDEERCEEDMRWRRERWRVLKKEVSEVNRRRAKEKNDEGNNDSDENEGASLNETCQ